MIYCFSHSNTNLRTPAIGVFWGVRARCPGVPDAKFTAGIAPCTVNPTKNSLDRQEQPHPQSNAHSFSHSHHATRTASAGIANAQNLRTFCLLKKSISREACGCLFKEIMIATVFEKPIPIKESPIKRQGIFRKNFLFFDTFVFPNKIP